MYRVYYRYIDKSAFKLGFLSAELEWIFKDKWNFDMFRLTAELRGIVYRMAPVDAV